MIADEAGCVWRCVRVAHGPRGEQLLEYDCPGRPRLRRMVQRPTADGPLIESYHVQGLAQVYHTPGEAVAALKANP
jgi:hypothetical protein